MEAQSPLFKVVSGIVGLILGGAAGWLIGIWVAVAIVEPGPEPEGPLYVGLLGVVMGTPIGALIGSVLGVVFADRIALKLSKLQWWLPTAVASLVLFFLAIWFLMEYLGVW
jgi:hypothetical protein